jgi:hypothetical protein
MRPSTVSVEHLFVLFALDDELETPLGAPERPDRGSGACGVLPI